MEKQPLNIGVINPYALAEVVLGRPVRWNQISNPEELLESTLQTPFEKLFDPKDASPLYAGLELQKDKTMRRLEGEEAMKSVDKVAIPGARMLESVKPMKIDADRVRTALRTVLSPNEKAAADWNPPKTAWIDMGDFFEETTEPGDPLQGALGDCYFIAALGAVSWARPYVIAHRNRRTGMQQEAFVDMVEFFDNGARHQVEVSERLPVTEPMHHFKFAKSSEVGEVWPAVYEKAYAKMKTGTKSDHPEYPKIAGGDPVRACAELINGSRHYVWTAAHSPHELWQEVRKQSLSCRTVNPMVAWTYPSSAAAPDPDVDYGKFRIVANHAYTVLGWTFQDNEKYIVLRNPWGTHIPTQDVLSGKWYAHDVTYWRPTQLNNRGFFALKASTFKKYFQGLGYAK